eukprot:scpid106261/ scgid18300/ 
MHTCNSSDCSQQTDVKNPTCWRRPQLPARATRLDAGSWRRVIEHFTHTQFWPRRDRISKSECNTTTSHDITLCEQQLRCTGEMPDCGSITRKVLPTDSR